MLIALICFGTNMIDVFTYNSSDNSDNTYEIILCERKTNEFKYESSQRIDNDHERGANQIQTQIQNIINNIQSWSWSLGSLFHGTLILVI